MLAGRAVACYGCSKNKKRCVFSTPESTSCLACSRKGLVCAGGGQQRKSLAVTASLDIVGQSSLSWKLSTQALSFSLTHHLLSLHIRHRPPRMFGGILEHEWDGIGDISLSVNGKMDELSPVIQALVAIGLADGARLSTHSAIVGASNSPLPQFGAFTNVDDTLSTLGGRRRDAVTALNARAMAYLDLALYSPEGVDPSTKLQLLWIATAVMVETPESRSWCREMSVRCAKYIFECLGKEGLDESQRMKLYEQSYMVIMWESIRSASLGINSSLTQQEYITAVPYMTYPSPPICYPTQDEFDSFLVPGTLDTDFTPFHALLERLFNPWRLRYIKVIFVFTYGREKVTLTQLVTLMWEWMDQIWAFGGAILMRLLADPRYAEVEKSRNSPQRESWVLIQMTLKHFFISESIYASLILGCHLRIVQDEEGEVKKHLLAPSQKRCYEALQRMDFVCGLRDIQLDFHEYDSFLRSIQLIVGLPENGPCSTICLEDFPHLLKAFEFMSFSNGECGDFLQNHGRKSLASSDPEPFADGTAVSELLPQQFVLLSSSSPPNPSSIPSSADTSLSLPPTVDSEQQASRLVASVLTTLSEPQSIVEDQLFHEMGGESGMPSPALSSDSGLSSEEAGSPASSVHSSMSSCPTEASITSEIEAIVVKLFSAAMKVVKEEKAVTFVPATLQELSDETLVERPEEGISITVKDNSASKLVPQTLE